MPLGVGAGLAIGGALSAAGTVGGALLAKGGSNKAADAMSDASEAALALQREQLDYNREIYQRALKQFNKYRTTGFRGLEQMKTYLGEENPLFDWQADKEIRYARQGLAARGLTNSGAGLQLESDIMNRLAGQEYLRQYGVASDLANIGMTSTSNATSAGTQSAQIGANLGNSMANTSWNAGLGQAQLAWNTGQQQASLWSGLGQGLGGMVGSYFNQQAPTTTAPISFMNTPQISAVGGGYRIGY